MAGDSEEPPYATGLAALRDGWRLLQMAPLQPHAPGAEFTTAYLKYEFLVRAMGETWMAERVLLNSQQMATFVARGFLRFDAVVPAAINEQFIDEVGRPPKPGAGMRKAYARLLAGTGVPTVAAGTPLARVLSGRLRRHAAARIAGGARRDRKPRRHESAFRPSLSARDVSAGVLRGARHPERLATHASGLDDRHPPRAFDVQMMYYPHDVTPEMGGTRFIPGTHLRIVSEAAVARYQNVRGQQHVVCPAGTLLFLHHGIWHGGGVNRSDRLRYMFKIRMNPTVRQLRLWDTSDLPNDHHRQRPIFLLKEAPDPTHVHTILTTPEPWFEADTGRLEFLNRIRLWRYLLGDEQFDVDYWMTRIENEPTTSVHA